MQNDESISAVRQFLRKRWVKTILIIDALAIIAVIAVVIWNATKTATINFNITPIDAKIQIDGRGDYANGSYQIHPGSHEITISHDGLAPKTFTIDTSADYISSLTTFLAAPDDNFDFYRQKSNYESYQKLTDMASADHNVTTDHDISAEQFIQTFEQNYAIFNLTPIIDRTPTACGTSCGSRYQYDTLTISDGQSLEACTQTLCLYITDTTGKKENFALSVIKKLGYDPSQFQIIYEKVEYE